MKHKNEKPYPLVSEWPIVLLAKRAASAQLEYYRRMMAEAARPTMKDKKGK